MLRSAIDKLKKTYHTITDPRVFLPMVGFIASVGSAVFFWRRDSKGSGAPMVVAALAGSSATAFFYSVKDRNETKKRNIQTKKIRNKEKIANALGKGEIFSGEQDFQKAMIYYQQAEKAISEVKNQNSEFLCEQRELIMLRIAQTYYKLRQFTKALEVIAKISSPKFYHKDILNMEGLCQLQLGDNVKASQSLKASLKLDPSQSDIRLMFYYSNCRLKEAASDEKIVEIKSLENTESDYFEALLAHLPQHLEESLHGSTLESKLEPLRLAYVTNNLIPEYMFHKIFAEIHVRQKKFQNAVESYNSALCKLPNTPIYEFERAQLLKKCGDCLFKITQIESTSQKTNEGEAKSSKGSKDSSKDNSLIIKVREYWQASLNALRALELAPTEIDMKEKDNLKGELKSSLEKTAGVILPQASLLNDSSIKSNTAAPLSDNLSLQPVSQTTP